MLVVLSAAAGMGLVASFLGYALTSARVITVQPVLLTVTLTILVMCCVTVVPRYGGDGAAWALVAASSAHALVSWLALHRFAWKQSESLPSDVGLQKSFSIGSTAPESLSKSHQQARVFPYWQVGETSNK